MVRSPDTAQVIISLVAAVIVVAAVVVVVRWWGGDQPGDLYAFDRESGTLVWHRSFPASTRS